jgi:hypothetical protein
MALLKPPHPANKSRCRMVSPIWDTVASIRFQSQSDARFRLLPLVFWCDDLLSSDRNQRNSSNQSLNRKK